MCGHSKLFLTWFRAGNYISILWPTNYEKVTLTHFEFDKSDQIRFLGQAILFNAYDTMRIESTQLYFLPSSSA